MDQLQLWMKMNEWLYAKDQHKLIMIFIADNEAMFPRDLSSVGFEVGEHMLKHGMIYIENIQHRGEEIPCFRMNNDMTHYVKSHRSEWIDELQKYLEIEQDMDSVTYDGAWERSLLCSP